MSSNSLKEIEKGLRLLEQIKQLVSDAPLKNWAKEGLIERLDMIGMVEGFIDQTKLALDTAQKDFPDVLTKDQESSSEAAPN